MTVKEFYEYLLSLGAENLIICSSEWGNITKDDIFIDFEHHYVSI